MGEKTSTASLKPPGIAVLSSTFRFRRRLCKGSPRVLFRGFLLISFGVREANGTGEARRIQHRVFCLFVSLQKSSFYEGNDVYATPRYNQNQHTTTQTFNAATEARSKRRRVRRSASTHFLSILDSVFFHQTDNCATASVSSRK